MKTRDLAALGFLIVAIGIPAQAALKHSQKVTLAASAPVGVTLALDRAAYVARSTPPTVLHATMTVFNHSNTPVQFSIRGLGCNWQILDDQRKVVWDYSVGKMMPHMVRLRTLTNQEMIFRQDIPLQTQEGTPLPSGRYSVRGQLMGTPSLTAEVAFTVSGTDKASN